MGVEVLERHKSVPDSKSKVTFLDLNIIATP